MRGVIAAVLVLAMSWPASRAQTPLEDLSNYLGLSGGAGAGAESPMAGLSTYTQGIKNIMGGIVGADEKHKKCLQKLLCNVSELCPSITSPHVISVCIRVHLVSFSSRKCHGIKGKTIPFLLQ